MVSKIASPTLENSELNSYEELLSDAKHYADNARAKNTLRCYRSDFDGFRAWCKERGLDPLPAHEKTVITYICQLAKTHKISSIKRKLAAISVNHQNAKLSSPTTSPELRTVFQGIKRQKGMRQTKKAPLLSLHIKEICSSLGNEGRDLRDKALIMTGYIGALRRSELISLDFEDIRLCEQGLVLMVKKSKTDQYAFGREVGVCRGENSETCPVEILLQWLRFAKIASGPLFRPINKADRITARRLCDQSVADIIKARAGVMGFASSEVSGHSMRRGLVTSAASAGAHPLDIQRHTGHASLEMLSEYIDHGTVFKNNVTGKLGL